MLLRGLRWGLAGVLVAWTVIRLLGLDRGWPLVPLFAFTPWVAALALLGALAATLFRRWLFALVDGGVRARARRLAGAAGGARTARRPMRPACGCASSPPTWRGTRRRRATSWRSRAACASTC